MPFVDPGEPLVFAVEQKLAEAARMVERHYGRELGDAGE